MLKKQVVSAATEAIRREIEGTEKLSNLPKVTQVENLK